MYQIKLTKEQKELLSRVLVSTARQWTKRIEDGAALNSLRNQIDRLDELIEVEKIVSNAPVLKD